MEREGVGGLKRAVSILPIPFWVLTVSWFVGWDKALNLCVSKSKWWILSHLHCLLTDGSCTWLTALFPHYFDLKMPASRGVAMQRHIACRASEQVSRRYSTDDNDDGETYLTSQKMPNSLQNNTLGRLLSTLECGRKLCKVEKESRGLPKLNLPYFTIAKPLIITTLVQNQTARQLFDEFLEIKSAKCCWHLATKLNGNSLTQQKFSSSVSWQLRRETMKAQRLWPSTFHAPYETVCQVVSKVFHGAAKDTSLSPVPEKVNYSSSLYLNVLSESYEVTGKGLGLSLSNIF